MLRGKGKPGILLRVCKLRSLRTVRLRSVMTVEVETAAPEVAARRREMRYMLELLALLLMWRSIDARWFRCTAGSLAARQDAQEEEVYLSSGGTEESW